MENWEASLQTIAQQVNMLTFAIQRAEGNFKAEARGEMIRATGAMAPGFKLRLRQSLAHINELSGKPFDMNTDDNRLSVTLRLRDQDPLKLARFIDQLDQEIQLERGTDDKRRRGR